MNYNFSEITYPSCDGIHTVYAELYTPKTRSAKGIVQLSHGMIDHVGRYRALAEYLTGEGYILAGNHHLGHGRSVLSRDDYGFFAERGGAELVIGRGGGGQQVLAHHAVVGADQHQGAAELLHQGFRVTGKAGVP